METLRLKKVNAVSPGPSLVAAGLNLNPNRPDSESQAHSSALSALSPQCCALALCFWTGDTFQPGGEGWGPSFWYTAWAPSAHRPQPPRGSEPCTPLGLTSSLQSHPYGVLCITGNTKLWALPPHPPPKPTATLGFTRAILCMSTLQMKVEAVWLQPGACVP